MAAEKELELLRNRLREQEEQVHKAAQAGLGLLNQQVELQSQLDEQRVEMTKTIEALEQDKYSLQRELDLKTQMLEFLQSDYETFKKQQKQTLDEHQEHLERSHNMALSELHNKILKMQSALEESQLMEKQLKHKLEVQTETLNNKVEELRAVNDRSQTLVPSEMMEVQISELENRKVELEQTLQESLCREQQVELRACSLQRQLERLTEEKEEREREAVSCFNALEKSREVNRDLQIQLDQVLQQAQDPNSKGNSLFAELEDKRAEMEKQLISMKVQYQSLQKHHAFSKQQMQRMKIQIATLMQLLGSKADSDQVERLQDMLSEKNEEIRNLNAKLQRLERSEILLKAHSASRSPAGNSDGPDETYYTDLLRMKLSNSEKDVERLGDELSRQRMKSLSESQRALQLERKLFKSEQLLKQAQSDKLKLQLRVEELQYKYEPKEVEKIPVQRKRREKLPVDIPAPPEGVARGEQMAAVEVTDSKTADLEAVETNRCSEASGSDPRPAKCVRISVEDSDVTDSRPLPKENQQQNERKEGRRRRLQPVEVIHVKSNNSMENQCAQQ
uniref:Protein Spindly n=1 Tax=Nothobranchius kuhntae TaxID=321403 RepID=A0A1A8JIB7_NOTKU